MPLANRVAAVLAATMLVLGVASALAVGGRPADLHGTTVAAGPGGDGGEQAASGTRRPGEAASPAEGSDRSGPATSDTTAGSGSGSPGRSDADGAGPSGAHADQTSPGSSTTTPAPSSAGAGSSADPTVPTLPGLDPTLLALLSSVPQPAVPSLHDLARLLAADDLVDLGVLLGALSPAGVESLTALLADVPAEDIDDVTQLLTTADPAEVAATVDAVLAPFTGDGGGSGDAGGSDGSPLDPVTGLLGASSLDPQASAAATTTLSTDAAAALDDALGSAPADELGVIGAALAIVEAAGASGALAQLVATAGAANVPPIGALLTRLTPTAIADLAGGATLP